MVGDNSQWSCDRVVATIKLQGYSALSAFEKSMISHHLAWYGDICTCGVDLQLTKQHLLDVHATAFFFGVGLGADEDLVAAAPQN